MRPRRVVWVHPHAHNDGVCSVRVNAKLPAAALAEYTGWETAVVRTLDEVGNADVVVCMAVQDVDAAIAGCEARRWGSVVAFQSDGPELNALQQQCVDAIVCDSEYLRTKIHPRHCAKTTHIPDCLEVPTLAPRQHPGKPLVLAWIGATGNYRFAKDTVDLLRTRWRVEVVSDGLEATIPWRRDVHDELAKCDVGITPYPPDLICDPGSFSNFRYKDSCRVILFQALGMPTIVSSHPAHLQHVVHCADGLIANRPQDWVACVEALQEDPTLYRQLSHVGISKARANWPDRVAKMWHDMVVFVTKV